MLAPSRGALSLAGTRKDPKKEKQNDFYTMKDTRMAIDLAIGILCALTGNPVNSAYIYRQAV
jgi:hypothetical protein